MNEIPLPAKREDRRLRNRGITSLGCLVWILIVAILTFFGVKIGQAYWNYYNVREQVREALVWAVGSMQPKAEGDVAQRVLSNATGVGVNLTSRNIRISQTPDVMTITTAWQEEVDLLFYTFPLNFEVNLSEIKRWGRGGLVVK
jgi:hypothetical protein